MVDPVTNNDNAEVISSVGIEVKGLYKIFGPTPDKYLEDVKGGMSKDELRDNHGHVLGLKDIHINMKAGGLQVVMGLAGAGKRTLNSNINRLTDPNDG